MQLLGAARRMAARLSEGLTVLTGAGISAESGIPTFRGADGLWRNHRWQDLATPEAFARDPELVMSFYNKRRHILDDVAPNPAHTALARLEAALGGRFALVTQNIDDLHERGGSTHVLHMHGELTKRRCASCGHVDAYETDLRLDEPCPCGGLRRPHVVWFGEVPFHLDDAIPEALQHGVFLSIGTSGTVYPAAGFVSAARAHGSLTAEINLEPSDNAHLFDIQLTGTAGEVVPQLTEQLLQELDHEA